MTNDEGIEFTVILTGPGTKGNSIPVDTLTAAMFAFERAIKQETKGKAQVEVFISEMRAPRKLYNQPTTAGETDGKSTLS